MLIVATYHYIRPSFDAKYPAIFGVTPHQFENQLNELSKHGEFIAPNEILELIHKGLDISGNKILITFDDGLKEQFDFAHPILAKKNIKAWYFINTCNHAPDNEISSVHQLHLLRANVPAEELKAAIGLAFPNIAKLSDEDKTKAKQQYIYDTPNEAELKYIFNFKLPFLERDMLIDKIFTQYFPEKKHQLQNLYMDEMMIKILAKDGQIGSHAHHHFPIGLLNQNEIEFELSHSKNKLQEIIGATISGVCYPYGNSRMAPLIAQNCGYKIGFTTIQAPNFNIIENPLALKRFDCNALPFGKKSIFKENSNIFEQVKEMTF